MLFFGGVLEFVDEHIAQSLGRRDLVTLTGGVKVGIQQEYWRILASILYVLFWIEVFAGIINLFILIATALKKYVNSKEVREEKNAVGKSLGVSRQSVSKWETAPATPPIPPI